MSDLHPGDVHPGDIHGIVGKVVARRLRVLALRDTLPRLALYEVEPPGVGVVRRALKAITVPEARDLAARERLRHWIDAMRRIDEIRLETIYELGTLDDDTPYVLSEWCRQPRLSNLLAGGLSLAPDRAVRLIDQISGALAALHTHGLCHGEPLPENILFDLGSLDGDIRLIDGAITGALHPSPIGGLSGGISYLAPERLDGAPPTPATDVYALGVLAYRLLAGRLPFLPGDERANEAGADPVDRVRWLHRNAAPARPSRGAPGLPIPAAIEAVVGCALAKDPEQRLADAGIFNAALRRALEIPPEEAEEARAQIETTQVRAGSADMKACGPDPAPGSTRSVLVKYLAAGAVAGAAARLLLR